MQPCFGNDFHLLCFCVCVCQVVWRNRELCSLQQINSSLRDGHEGQGECLPPGLLRMPALQSKVSHQATVLLLSDASIQADGWSGKQVCSIMNDKCC